MSQSVIATDSLVAIRFATDEGFARGLGGTSGRRRSSLSQLGVLLGAGRNHDEGVVAWDIHGMGDCRGRRWGL